MINDKEYIKWLETTAELINKYNLKDLIIKNKEMHPFDKVENKIISKDMFNKDIIILDSVEIIEEDKEIEENSEGNFTGIKVYDSGKVISSITF